MGKFDLYKIDLKGMSANIQNYEYLLDNQFFIDISEEGIQAGRVNVKLTVTNRRNFFDLAFVLSGVAVVPCNRCLEDMDFSVETTAHLVVKFGKDYDEESDEIVVIPESEGSINLAWFLYEFVVLAIPIKSTHIPGKCNRQMTEKLKKHMANLEEDDDAFDADMGGDADADELQ